MSCGRNRGPCGRRRTRGGRRSGRGEAQHQVDEAKGRHRTGWGGFRNEGNKTSDASALTAMMKCGRLQGKSGDDGKSCRGFQASPASV